MTATARLTRPKMPNQSCIKQIITAREAEQLWNLASGTVRAACGRGVIQGRKSAGTWLVSRSEMKRHYGKEK